MLFIFVMNNIFCIKKNINLYQQSKRNKINSYQVKENVPIFILALRLMFNKPCFIKLVSPVWLKTSRFKDTIGGFFWERKTFYIRLWVGYVIYFEFTPVFLMSFKWMFSSLVKEINRLLKEINRLLIKGMSNIYLKVTIQKKWRTQNFNFQSIKSLSPGQFLETCNLSRYHWILKLFVPT